MNLKRQSDDEPAHIPFYKDERIIGKRVTVSIYLRVLIVALSVFVITIGIVLYTLINYLGHAHTDRLKNQQDTNDQIARLACLSIYGLPDSAGENVARTRKAYNCPPPVRPSSVPPSASATPHA